MLLQDAHWSDDFVRPLHPRARAAVVVYKLGGMYFRTFVLPMYRESAESAESEVVPSG